MTPVAERVREWRARQLPSIRPVVRPRKHEAPDPPCLRFILPVPVHRGGSDLKVPLVRPADDGDPGVECQTFVYVVNGKPAPGIDASILQRANRGAELRESARPCTMNFIENPQRRPKKVYVYRQRKTPANVPLGPAGRREDVTVELCRSLLATGMSARQVAERLGTSRRTVCNRLKKGKETEAMV